MTAKELLDRVVTEPLRAHVSRMYPQAKVVSIEALGPDAGARAGATTKAAGYGLPVRIVLEENGEERALVWRVASANEFGHDRRADRAAAMVQAVEDFEQTPQHVRVVDAG